MNKNITILYDPKQPTGLEIVDSNSMYLNILSLGIYNFRLGDYYNQHYTKYQDDNTQPLQISTTPHLLIPPSHTRSHQNLIALQFAE